VSSEQSAVRHGSKIGRFVVVAELGSGGMGVVYAAHDRELDRQVALKVMRGVSDDDEDRKRMLREGQAMARITHPNVITVFEVGTHHDSTVFLAQELLDGGPLSKWLQDKHTQDEILEKFVAAGRGLAAAHAAGLVHRDFKPDNVLLGKDGRVRVADFGLARSLGAGTDPAAMMATAPGGGPPRGQDIAVTQSPFHNNLTRTGAVMGTPMFMAPEQHEGLRADERSDQFAFCVALYHALHGDWPYDGKTSVALADNVINNVRKPPPKSAAVPARIRKIIDRGLSTKAEDRYPSMDALLADLTYRPRAKWPAAVAGLVLLAGAAAGAFLMMREEAKLAPAIVKFVPPLPADTFDPAVLVEALDKDNVNATRRQLESAAARAQDKAQAAILQASVAYVSVLAGDLIVAEVKLKDAEARAKELAKADARVAGYVELAGAAVASARGELATAKERSERCAAKLSVPDPIPASICYQMLGEAFFELGDTNAATLAFDAAKQHADRIGNKYRSGHIELEKAQLAYDMAREELTNDPALATQRIKDVEDLQRMAHTSKAASCEAGAAALAARMKMFAMGNRRDALDVFNAINPEAIEQYELKMLTQIARGEVLGNEGADGDATGIDYIADAIDDAKNRGYWGLVLEAELAHVRLVLPLQREGAEEERQKLVAEANAKGYKRIARLAESAAK
jgi:hypothetical protein